MSDGIRINIDEVLGGPAETQTLAATIAHRLRTLILDGQLPPDTRLPLANVATSLGVSVMPVRDALRRLEAERLVVMRPHRGAVVARLSADDAEEIYAMRVALEALCARRAAERLGPDEVSELQIMFRQMEAAHEAADLATFIECDRAFHGRLYAFSGSRRLIGTIEELQNRCRRYLKYLYEGWETVQDPLEAHRPLLAAVEAGDPQLVERLTREHMQDAADRLLKEIRKAAEAPIAARPESAGVALLRGALSADH